jgi:selenocysteine lyase/cysteine desulfurase
VAARRHGLTVHHIPERDAEERLADAVAERCGPRTRLVALSHVCWITGAVLDVAGAAAAARAAGALTLVDGAQAAGAIPVDAAALGVDAYAFPAQKWLLGPEGLGALWVPAAARERIDLSFSGFEAGSAHTPEGALDVHPGARRYEHSTFPVLLVPAWTAALEWLGGIGWDRVHAGTAAALAAGRAAIEAIPGVRVRTPPGPQAGLLAFSVDGRSDVSEACLEMAARDVVIRWIPGTDVLRASLGFFTDTDDVEALAAAVAAVAA